LGKDEASRLSDWAEDLTDSQRLYAALDVYATRLAYQTIMSKLSPVDLVKPRRMKDLEVGTKVVVVARGRADSIAGGDIREVSGEGNWCVLASSEAGTRASTITKRGRVVVRVREVYEPGAPLPYADMHGEKGKTLESALQQPDYDMLVDWQCLRMLQYPPLQPPPPLTTAAAPARDLEARMRLEARDREIIEQDERVVAALRAAAPHDLPLPPEDEEDEDEVGGHSTPPAAGRGEAAGQARPRHAGDGAVEVDGSGGGAGATGPDGATAPMDVVPPQEVAHPISSSAATAQANHRAHPGQPGQPAVPSSAPRAPATAEANHRAGAQPGHPAAPATAERVSRRKRAVFKCGCRVKCDVYHWLQRILETILKTHGAFQYLCARLSDAVFIVDPDDLERVRQVVMRTMDLKDDKEWRRYMNQHWWKLLKHCRRYISPPEELVKRLEIVFELYNDLPDAKTCEPLFRPETHKRWAAFIEHARKGCLSDPDPADLPLYFVASHTKTGLPVYGCCRGTVDLEGYHQKIRDLVEGWNVGIEHVDLSIREFNFRWNLSMEAKHLGMDGDLINFYELERVEAILEIAQYWWEEPLFPTFRSSASCSSTGETFGLLDRGGSAVNQDEEPPMIESEGAAAIERLEEEEEEEEEGCADRGEAGEVSNDGEGSESTEGSPARDGATEGETAALRQHQSLEEKYAPRGSSTYYAQYCKQDPPQRIKTEAERTYFREEKDKYLVTAVGKVAGDFIEDGYNFTRFTESWNRHIQRNPVKDMFRKSVKQLVDFWRMWVIVQNRISTMEERAPQENQMRRDFRATHPQEVGINQGVQTATRPPPRKPLIRPTSPAAPPLSVQQAPRPPPAPPVSTPLPMQQPPRTPLIRWPAPAPAALGMQAMQQAPQPPPGLPLNPLMGTPQALPPWALPGPPGIGLLPPVAWQNNQASMDRQAWHLFVIYID
jgi:hypothetical protein